MEPTLRQALVGAGSNLGDRVQNLTAAIERLKKNPNIFRLRSSSWYETDPVGLTDQPLFLNLVVGFQTSLTPEALLEVLFEIERSFGRVRTHRWGPRTLDLDLLAFEGEARSSPELQLPHPRMFERGFVTVPLAEVLTQESGPDLVWDQLRGQLKNTPPSSGVRRWTAPKSSV